MEYLLNTIEPLPPPVFLNARRLFTFAQLTTSRHINVGNIPHQSFTLTEHESSIKWIQQLNIRPQMLRLLIHRHPSHPHLSTSRSLFSASEPSREHSIPFCKRKTDSKPENLTIHSTKIQWCHDPNSQIWQKKCKLSLQTWTFQHITIWEFCLKIHTLNIQWQKQSNAAKLQHIYFTTVDSKTIRETMHQDTAPSASV